MVILNRVQSLAVSTTKPMVLKFHIFSFFVLTKINSLDAITPSVNFYVEYINNSKERALQYEFRDDEAHMYQARNQSPQGKKFIK